MGKENSWDAHNTVNIQIIIDCLSHKQQGQLHRQLKIFIITRVRFAIVFTMGRRGAQIAKFRYGIEITGTVGKFESDIAKFAISRDLMLL